MFTSSSTKNLAQLENVVVTTQDGRTFNLGSPNSKLFNIRVFLYKIRRKING